MPTFATWRAILCLCLLMLLAACAGNTIKNDAAEPESAQSAEAPPTNPRDPYEEFNRAMFAFNDALDKAILKPVAKGYRYITPNPVESGISNFFNNLGAPINIINNLLQAKFVATLSETGRFVINSTIGVLGFFDPATSFGLEEQDEDFGQTLAVWGIPSGPYLVLPFLGPSTFRATGGMVPGYYSHPLTYYHNHGEKAGITAMMIIDTRAQLLDLESFIKDVYDPYTFIRDAYLQRRKYLIYDGHPPVEYPSYFDELSGYEVEEESVDKKPIEKDKAPTTENAENTED